MKTVRQAILDEIYYPIPDGYVENKLIERDIDGETEFSAEVAKSHGYLGALADCLLSLVQAVNISEAGKSVSAMTDADKQRILRRCNAIYKSIGEEEVDTFSPMVYIE